MNPVKRLLSRFRKPPKPPPLPDLQVMADEREMAVYRLRRWWR